jgi:peptidoglycan-N-acetylglucosamine deacetylase
MKTRSLSLFLKLFIAAAVLFTSIALTSPASAQTSCGERYTVVRGDTLRRIASNCGTTVAALRRANPEITNANLISVGQVLVLPGTLIPGTGTEDIYIVNRGDTLNKLAVRFNTTVNRLLALNTAITNANIIYEGQRLAVPSSRTPAPTPGQTYTVVRGDTLRSIAVRFNTTVDEILKLNPDIKDANRISVGQKIILPSTVSSYTVVRGDTLRKIAERSTQPSPGCWS